MFRAHYRSLVRSLAVAAGDATLAEEAVQEAFARAHIAWRRIGTYDDPVAWVRRVAINRIKDQHRRDRRKRAALARMGPDLWSELPADGSVEVRAAIGGLPLRQRLAVALHYLDGLSVAETAAAMGISEGSVKTHLARARSALHPVLEELR